MGTAGGVGQAGTEPRNRDQALGRRRRRRWALPLAVVIGSAAGAVGLASPAWAGEPSGADFPAFTISPRSGLPGTAVTASGAGCTGAQGGQVSFNRVGHEAPLVTTAITVHSSGEWASTVSVPVDVPAGEYTIGAICTFERGTPNLYRENTFTVVAGPPGGDRRLRVTPAAVPLGGSATVRGGGCMPPAFVIAAVTQNGSELEGAQVGSPNPAGQWTVRFVFKAGYVHPDATIAVTARCVEGPGRVRFTYDDRAVDVLPVRSAVGGSRASSQGGDRTPAVAPPDRSGSPASGAAGREEVGVVPADAAAEEPGGTSVRWVLGGAALAGLLVVGALKVLPRRRSSR
ncbi:MAG TPA: hypothetical protein VHG90_15020 [Acidimicrobiales bacterium]|nr:hypothetical protein [Acidimicrobiales bacterium]